MRAILTAAILLVASCTVADQADLAVPQQGSLADFRTYVQPVLAATCASFDCHGNAGRPLKLYSMYSLRIDAALRGHAESDAELTANMQAIAGLDPEAAKVEDHLLLLKPLAVAVGGLHHVGGDLWLDQNDVQYKCLHAWLRAGASDAAGQAVCTMAIPP